MKAGFIGLGAMGRAMAANLLRAGHDVAVWARRAESMAPLVALGARAAASPADCARGADAVLCVVTAGPDVRQVALGADGVIESALPGCVFIDHSTIPPSTARDIADALAGRGIDMLDAPVSGGEVGAINATLSIMVGGKAEVFERVRPVFECLGKNITLVGETGAGQTCKVANQIVVALTIQAVAEGLLFAARAGADPAKVRQALMGGLATSRILEVHGDRMIRRTVEPGFRIALHQKDLNLALGAAKSLGVALPATAQAQQLFSACVAHGGAGWDHSGLVRALEKLSNFEIGQQPT